MGTVVLIRGVSGSGKREAAKRYKERCPTAIEVHSELAPSECDPFLWLYERVETLVKQGKNVIIVGQFKKNFYLRQLFKMVKDRAEFLVVNCSPRHADMQRWHGEIELRGH